MCVDGPEQVAELRPPRRGRARTLGVLIEVVDRRAAASTRVEEALRLADAIHAAPGLELRGLQAYMGSAQHLRQRRERRGGDRGGRARAPEPVRDALGVRHVTGAGTGTYPIEVASGVWTEIQPGSYVLMDADYAPERGAAAVRQALHVLGA